MFSMPIILFIYFIFYFSVKIVSMQWDKFLMYNDGITF